MVAGPGYPDFGGEAIQEFLHGRTCVFVVADPFLKDPSVDCFRNSLHQDPDVCIKACFCYSETSEKNCGRPRLTEQTFQSLDIAHVDGGQRIETAPC